METPQFPCSDKRLSDSNHFAIEDLLDFPTDDAILSSDPAAAASTEESASALLDTSLASSYPADPQFSGELCVPYDELAELEWLSNIVDESFCSEDLQKLHLIQGVGQTATPEPVGPIPAEMLVPAKARSKRSRPPPGNWTSRLLAVTPAAPAEADGRIKKPAAGHRKKEEGAAEGRRCLHCATDKTPQWRTGPMGPKTLCNACGVRFKSGRLVPEYRPASSPTFVLAKHSNSHRKVLELRRQKEVQRAQMHQQQFMHHRHQNVVFDVASNGDDYLIHQHIGPDFRQLI